jgi:hypothetical protein
MKALIIQISDIHLKNGINVASERIKQVAKAVANVEVEPCAAACPVARNSLGPVGLPLCHHG